MKAKDLIAIIGPYPDMEINARVWDEEEDAYEQECRVINGIEKGYDENGDCSDITLKVS